LERLPTYTFIETPSRRAGSDPGAAADSDPRNGGFQPFTTLREKGRLRGVSPEDLT
jgi:hypothetical protein